MMLSGTVSRGCLAAVLWTMMASTTQAGPPDPSWRPVREAEGVAVYVRDVADSEFDESLGQTVMNVRLSSLVALIMDGNSHHRWIDSIHHSRRLGAAGPAAAYIYTLSEAPWPIADRDAVVLSQVEQDSNSLVVTIRSNASPGHLPDREGTVRIVRIESTWTLVPLEGGAVEVNYQVFSDPGGQLPTSLINSLASDQPFNTLTNLRLFLDNDSEYRNAVVPFIKEPGA